MNQVGETLNLKGVLNAALEITGKRRDTLARLRAALEQGNDVEALKLARELCGVDHEQKSHRTDPRVN
jgi:hypothetical protein